MSTKLVRIAMLSFCCLALGSLSADAQCTVSQLNTDGPITITSPVWLGQHFKACSNGQISSITFTPSFTKDFTFGIEANDRLVAPTFTQTISATAGVPFTVTVSPEFPVTNGSTYAFGIIDPLGGSTAMLKQLNNPYLDGTMFQMSGGIPVVPASQPDAQFEVVIDAAPVPVEAVTWGRIKSLLNEF